MKRRGFTYANNAKRIIAKKRRITSVAKRKAAISSGVGEKKHKMSALESQFEFPEIKNDWQDKAHTQKILGSDYVIIEPVSTVPVQPKQVEFELRDNEDVWSMGPNTRFKIEGQFQFMTPKEGDTPATEWAPCTATEVTEVVVAPNWFEMMLENVELFHGYSKINTSTDMRYVWSFINAFKYNFMTSEQKKLLCPQPCSPGFGIPSKRDSWTTAADSEWVKDYGPKIFTGKNISFDYIGLDFPPFFQNSNYLEKEQKIVPMPLLDKLTVRFIFNDDLTTIFNPKAGNKKKYRFFFNSIKFVVEKLKLSIAAKSAILDRGRKFNYPGVTRILKQETINATDLVHKAKIQGMLLPQGIMIFAVSKKLTNGTYTWEGSDNNVFMKHNIKSIDIKYGNLQFFMTRPNIGQINDSVIESKLYVDYLTAAPFGLEMDPNKVTLADIDDGWSSTAYPHVFINLCNYGDKSRIVPYLNTGSMLKFENDCEITLEFGGTGAVADVTYIIAYYYTDNNLTLDTTHKNQSFFKSPYLKLV